jgi:hypothetical protein
MSALLTAVPFLTSITTKECGLGIANESQAEAQTGPGVGQAFLPLSRAELLIGHFSKNSSA